MKKMISLAFAALMFIGASAQIRQPATMGAPVIEVDSAVAWRVDGTTKLYKNGNIYYEFQIVFWNHETPVAALTIYTLAADKLAGGYAIALTNGSYLFGGTDKVHVYGFMSLECKVAQGASLGTYKVYAQLFDGQGNSVIMAGTMPDFIAVDYATHQTNPEAAGIVLTDAVGLPGGLFIPDYVRPLRENIVFGTICLPKDGKMYGATLYEPAYKSCSMIFFAEVNSDDIVGGKAYLFKANEGYSTIAVKYNNPANPEAGLQNNGAMIGAYEQTHIDYTLGDYAIVRDNKYYRVNSDNVYVGANCAYIDMNQISGNVAPVPGRRYIFLQEASVNEVTGIEDIEANENANVQKVMVDGQLIIIRNAAFFYHESKGKY